MRLGPGQVRGTREPAAAAQLPVDGDANSVAEADVQSIHAMGLDDAGIVELTLLAAYYGMTARYLLALDVDLDEGKSGFDSFEGLR